MPDETSPFSLRLDRETSILLEGFAKSGKTSRGQVIRDALIGFAELYAGGLIEHYEMLERLAEELDEDTTLVLWVEADENDEPVVRITFSWSSLEANKPLPAAPEISAIGRVVGDRVHIYLNAGESVARPSVVSVGGNAVYVPTAHVELGSTLAWPPKEEEAIRIRPAFVAEILKRDGSGFDGVAEASREYLDLIQAIGRRDRERSDEKVDA
jgi:hypothetical protein